MQKGRAIPTCPPKPWRRRELSAKGGFVPILVLVLALVILGILFVPVPFRWTKVCLGRPPAPNGPSAECARRFQWGWQESIGKQILGKLIAKNITPPSPQATPTLVACIQVITPAKNPQTGECKEFSTPCNVPSGWTVVESCSQ